MTWWPGWNSIDGAGWWSGFYFWLGIVALFLLGTSELISYRYGLRKHELVAVSERNADRARADNDNPTENDTAALSERQLGDQESAGDGSGQAVRRKLADAQRNILIAALSQFRGQKIDIVSAVGDTDGNRYAEDFALMFVAAGWDIGEGPREAVFTPAPPVGIQIAMNEGDVDAGRIPSSLKALAYTLAALKIIPQNTAARDANAPAGRITFRVGRAPPLQ